MRSSSLRTTATAAGVALGLLTAFEAGGRPSAQSRVQGAHERAKDPRAVTDELDLTVPGTPIDHPARVYPASDSFPTGPAVGERLPDFTLPNQRGTPVGFHADRGQRKAIVSFQRSAVW